jgi:hypothetical protein
VGRRSKVKSLLEPPDEGGAGESEEFLCAPCRQSHRLFECFFNDLLIRFLLQK